MLQKARLFFAKRKILEVDCPILSKHATIDAHIDVMKTEVCNDEIGYLHTSPEYGMKRLLSEGFSDLYQISHVFRKEEQGALHNPEFTLIEWYRKDFSFEKMIQETIFLIRLFLGKLSSLSRTYRTLFLEKLSLDPFAAPKEALFSLLQKRKISLPKEAISWDRETLLQLILSHLMEPSLGKDHLFILTDFPPKMAALSQIQMTPHGNVAKRFEIYYRGIELANGYLELNDPEEQKRRFEEWNQIRKKSGKETYALDHRLLSSLPKIPLMTGVAVGFDRLMMLRHKKNNLAEVLPFSWATA